MSDEKNQYMPDPNDAEARRMHDDLTMRERIQFNILVGKVEQYWISELQNDQQRAAYIRSEMHETLDLFLDLIHDHSDKLRQIKARKGL